jgi:hypothetical protein
MDVDGPFEIVMVTHFDQATWAEFERQFAEGYGGVQYYNSPSLITSTRVPSTDNVVIYVLEMRNDLNCLMGVGMIRNAPVPSPPRVYRTAKYNRVGYRILERVPFPCPCPDLSPSFIETVERTLFFGKSHCKRGKGIHQVNSISHVGRYIEPFRAAIQWRMRNHKCRVGKSPA